MWLILAFVSAFFLGLYDTSKKASLKNNPVFPVLLLNTIFSTIIFSPFLADYLFGTGWFAGTPFDTAPYVSEEAVRHIPHAHLAVALKSCIVLSSWIMGYMSIKNLPLTLVGPINASRPVLVLVGATLVFGERLNAYQWAGVLTTIFSIYMMSRAGKKENIDFKSNKWVWCAAGATIMGAVSGLYDKHILKALSPMFVQSWFNFYLMILMVVIFCLLNRFDRSQVSPFRWSWAIPLISIVICIGDFTYFTALNDPDSMISVASLVRRSSVIVSFLCGALIFRERNLRAKALDLGLIILGMVLIWIGTMK